MKDECVFVVKRAIADFGAQHGINGNALTEYVIGALHEGFNEKDDGGDPYYPSEDVEKVEWSDGGDESEDEDGDIDLSEE